MLCMLSNFLRLHKLELAHGYVGRILTLVSIEVILRKADFLETIVGFLCRDKKMSSFLWLFKSWGIIVLKELRMFCF